ncbi:MAG: hypothetical protein WD824_18860 [Cyclobacteriaceae bacterium]
MEDDLPPQMLILFMQYHGIINLNPFYDCDVIFLYQRTIIVFPEPISNFHFLDSWRVVHAVANVHGNILGFLEKRIDYL